MAGKLRITGGNLLGRLIDVPVAADKGELRPTPDRVRAAIFSSLGESVIDASVLDVFAGSGAQAFEALSRRAALATLIEKNPESALTIKHNAKKLELTAKTHVIVADAFREIGNLPKKSFDLIFADPPYLLEVDDAFWKNISELIRDDGIVVYRREKLSDLKAPEAFEVVREKKYGGTAVFFLRRAV